MPHQRPGRARLLRAGAGCALLLCAAMPAAAMARQSMDSSLPVMPYQVVVPGLASDAAPSTTPPTVIPDAAVTITGTSVANLNGDGTITNLTIFGKSTTGWTTRSATSN